MPQVLADDDSLLRGSERRQLMAVAFYDPKIGGYDVSTCLNSDR